MPSLGLGLGLHRANRALFRGLLDQYGGAAAAYSLRALSSGWLAGDVVEVRRDADGATGIIHKSFTEGEINSGVMLAWVTEFSGTANGFVSTWYDQSGFANDATQETTTSQPKIVDAGALVVGGEGNPTLRLDGVDDYFDTLHTASATMTIFGTSMTAVTNDFLLDMRDSGSDGVFLLSAINDSFSLKYNAVTITGSSGASGDKISSFLTSNGSQKVRINGAEVASGSDATAISVTTTTKIGVRNFATQDSNLWLGDISEIIIYDSDQSANFAAIETNINAFYTLY